ncbi:uncharacterized protein BDW70DRAFT_144964 [Aspergillus foveolatus]|uniref:uncharacterized protein n=1 Tax=Aspergillus foveolatus TaxID=210207 RepID=UPI003CCD7781
MDLGSQPRHGSSVLWFLQASRSKVMVATSLFLRAAELAAGLCRCSGAVRAWDGWELEAEVFFPVSQGLRSSLYLTAKNQHEAITVPLNP